MTKFRFAFFFIAVVLLGVFLSPEQIAQAQETRKVTVTGVEIFASPTSATLCVGEKKTISVRVWRNIVVTSPSGQEIPQRDSALSTRIDGTVSNPSVGSFRFGPGGRRSGSSKKSWFGMDFEDFSLPSEYTFKATKEGSTDLYFKAMIRDPRPGIAPYTASVTVPIEVKNCDYKVRLILNGGYQGGYYHGSMNSIPLRPITETSLEAQGTLTWTEQAKECQVTTDPSPLSTSVGVEGTQTDTDVTLNITFVSISHTICGSCAEGSACTGGSDAFPEINVSFSLADGGLQMFNNGLFTVVFESRKKK